jgi:hypothetical protein
VERVRAGLEGPAFGRGHFPSGRWGVAAVIGLSADARDQRKLLRPEAATWRDVLHQGQRRR